MELNSDVDSCASMCGCRANHLAACAISRWHQHFMYEGAASSCINNNKTICFQLLNKKCRIIPIHCNKHIFISLDLASLADISRWKGPLIKSKYSNIPGKENPRCSQSSFIPRKIHRSYRRNELMLPTNTNNLISIVHG